MTQRSHVARFGAAAFGAALLIWGCDEPQPAVVPPTPAPATAPAEEQRRRPTTQELSQGEWKTVPLSVLPMTLKVPASWQPVSMGDAQLLTMEGWSPNGMVQIRFAARPPVAADKFDAFVSGAKKAIDARGPRKLRFELRDHTNFKVLETQFTEDNRMMLSTDEHGNLSEIEGTPLTWSHLIFIPDSGGFKSYELKFAELSLEHYEKDSEFLQRVMSSLAHDPGRKP